MPSDAADDDAVDDAAIASVGGPAGACHGANADDDALGASRVAAWALSAAAVGGAADGALGSSIGGGGGAAVAAAGDEHGGSGARAERPLPTARPGLRAGALHLVAHRALSSRSKPVSSGLRIAASCLGELSPNCDALELLGHVLPALPEDDAAGEPRALGSEGGSLQQPADTSSLLAACERLCAAKAEIEAEAEADTEAVIVALRLVELLLVTSVALAARGDDGSALEFLAEAEPRGALAVASAASQVPPAQKVREIAAARAAEAEAVAAAAAELTGAAVAAAATAEKGVEEAEATALAASAAVEAAAAPAGKAGATANDVHPEVTGAGADPAADEARARHELAAALDLEARAQWALAEAAESEALAQRKLAEAFESEARARRALVAAVELEARARCVLAEVLQSRAACFGLRRSFGEALANFARAADAYRAAHATASVGFAGLVLSLGTCSALKGDDRRALELYEEARSAFEAAEALSAPGYAGLLQSLGVCLARGAGGPERSAELFRASEGVFQAAGAARTPGYAGLLHCMGNHLVEEGRGRQAMDVFAAASRVYDEAGATSSLRFAELLETMGAYYAEQGDSKEAIPLLAHAEQRFEALGPFKRFAGSIESVTEALARVRARLGGCFAAQGDTAQAMQLFAEAERTYESAGSSGSTGHAILLQAMGSCLLAEGEVESAMDLFEVADGMYQAAGGTWTAAYANLLQNMATALWSSGDMHRAMELLQWAQIIYKGAGATDSPSYAELLRSMALCYSEIGDVDQVSELLGTAEHIYQAAGATWTTGYAELLQSIALYFEVKPGGVELAARLLDQAEEVYTASGATCSMEYATLALRLADHASGQGDSVRALQLLSAAQRSHEALGAVTEAASAQLAEILRRRGMLLGAAGEVEEAIELLFLAERLLDDEARCRGGPGAVLRRPPTLALAELWRGLGLALAARGDAEEAQSMLERASGAYEALGATYTEGYAQLLQSTAALRRRLRQRLNASDFDGCVDGDAFSGAVLSVDGKATRSEHELMLKAHRMYHAAGATRSAGYAELLRSLGRDAVPEDCFGAMELFEEAENVYEKIRGTRTAGYADLLRSKGLCLRARGDGERAALYFEEAESLSLRAVAKKAGTSSELFRLMALGTKALEGDRAADAKRLALRSRRFASLAGAARLAAYCGGDFDFVVGAGGPKSEAMLRSPCALLDKHRRTAATASSDSAGAGGGDGAGQRPVELEAVCEIGVNPAHFTD